MHTVLVGKLEGKKPCGRPKYRWKNNMKMVIKETGWEGVDYIHLALHKDQWQALVNTAIILWLPYNARNFMASQATMRFTKKTSMHLAS
jgi:hypothetical protein